MPKTCWRALSPAKGRVLPNRWKKQNKHFSSAYGEEPVESWQRIFEHTKEHWPADDSAIIKLIVEKPKG